MAADKVLFRAGTQAQFDALTVKDANAIYFITDTQRIYKGNYLIGSTDVVFATEVPAYETAVVGKLYVVTTDIEVSIYIKGATEMNQIGGKLKNGAIDNIAIIDDSVLLKSNFTDWESTDTKIPTAGAIGKVIDELNKSIASASATAKAAFKSVEAKRAEDNSGTILTFTDTNGETADITIADLFLSGAEYNSDTHKLLLNVKGVDEPVEVDLADLVPQAVNTNQVAMAEDIIVTVDVGNFKKGDTVSITDFESLQAFLTGMLSQDSDPIRNETPAVTFSIAPSNTFKEVGDKFTASASSLALSQGSYIANGTVQNAGVSATAWEVTNNYDDEKLTAAGSFEEIQVTDAMVTNPYKITVTATGSDGNTPKTYLGKEYDADGSEGIKFMSDDYALTKTAVTGYRNGFFWGVLETSSAEAAITSEIIRKGTAKGNKYAAGTIGTSTKPVIKAANVSSPKRIFVACPATNKGVTLVQMPSASMYDCTSDFVKLNNTVTVEGANGYTGIAYNVWVYEPAAISSDQTFVVTLG